MNDTVVKNDEKAVSRECFCGAIAELVVCETCGAEMCDDCLEGHAHVDPGGWPVMTEPAVVFDWSVSFAGLRAANVRRRKELWGDKMELVPADLHAAHAVLSAAAIAIENIRRRPFITVKDIQRMHRHIARTVIAMDVLAARLRLDLGRIVVEQFNDESQRFGAKTIIPTEPPQIITTEQDTQSHESKD